MAEVAEKVAGKVERKNSGRGDMTRQVTEHGTTTIASSVVAKVAAIAAREVPGVHRLVTEGVGAAVSGLASRVIGADMRGRGVEVEVGQREAAVDLALVIDYGLNIAKVADAVRSNIMERVEGMTGLVVKEVNILVSDLYFPDDEVEEVAPTRRVE
jgi:uncharacterized alkaline shock family protein YloU